MEQQPEPSEAKRDPAPHLDSFKSTTTWLLVVGAFVVALSAYLLQRGVLTALGDVNATSGQRQDNYDGLGFTYATGSVLEPLVLAFACVCLSSLARARRRAWEGYLSNGGDQECAPWTLSSFTDLPDLRLRSWLRWPWTMSWLGLVIHAVAGVRVVQMGVGQWLTTRGDQQQQLQANGAMVPEPAVWVPVGVLMLASSALALWSVRGLASASREFALSLPKRSTVSAPPKS